MLSVTQMWRR